MIACRMAGAPDLAVVGRMLDACLVELFARPWGATGVQLADDVASGQLAIGIAVRGELPSPIGFIAWHRDYDIHHCVSGASTSELYVEPSHRALGVAPSLIAFACQQIAATGGACIKGTAVRSAVGLYDRVAWGWDCREVILGGRAFRVVASLSGSSARDIARGLPAPAWNHQP
jgi:GNAT superfamily N-acetyltransferase